MLRSTYSAATAVVCAAALCVSTRADSLDVVIELPGVGGGAFATAISDVGDVAGGVEIPGCFHAALWRHGIPVDLGVLGTPPSLPVASSGATDVNNRGDVVGNSNTDAPPPGSTFNFHAFLWADGVMRDLGVLGTFTFQFPDGSVITLDNSKATAVNDLRQVVGFSSTSSSFPHAFLWQDGTMTDLGVLPGSTSATSFANDINNAGQIVGQSVGRAVIWEHGEIRALPLLDPSRPFGDAQAINALGQVVGSGATEGGRRGFFWDGKRLTVLRPLPGDFFSWAFDLNDRGQVVGVSLGCCAPSRLVLWENGEPIAFPELPGGVFVAETGGPAINNRGQIVGMYQFDDSVVQHAFQILTR